MFGGKEHRCARALSSTACIPRPVPALSPQTCSLSPICTHFMFSSSYDDSRYLPRPPARHTHSPRVSLDLNTDSAICMTLTSSHTPKDTALARTVLLLTSRSHSF